MTAKPAPRAEVLFVTGTCKGQPAWFYLAVTPLKSPLFRREVGQAPSLDLTRYGHVLRSGWGKRPPADVRREMETEYGVRIRD